MFHVQTVKLLTFSLTSSQSDLSLSSLKIVHYIAAHEKLSPVPGSRSLLHYVSDHGHSDQVQVAEVGDRMTEGAGQGWVVGRAWAGLLQKNGAV